MSAKTVFFVILNFLVVVALVLYWINPGVEMDFTGGERNPNFNIGNSSNQLQFYNNMRFQDKEISYKISEECSLTKQKDMREAFKIVENETILEFYQVSSNEEISVNCEEKNRFDGDMYIAGEGGPTNITDSDLFKVILGGNILLLRDSNCERPNVGVHELLHVLGFNHSENKNNIMYPVSSCKQTIGEEIPVLINDLYSYPTKQDLVFDFASAEIDGRQLDLEFTVKNQGLKESEETVVQVYSGDKKIKEFDLDNIGIGGGLQIKVENILLTRTNIDELRLVIPESNAELANNNNEILLLKD